jgi:hypothetical protein
MGLQSIILRGRRRMADTMSNAVTITRPGAGPAGTYDPSTRTYTPAAPRTIYTGAAIVHAHSGTSDNEDRSVITNEYVVKVPSDVAVQRGDMVLVARSAFEPMAVGLTLWVQTVTIDEWSVARVAVCTAQAPEVRP